MISANGTDAEHLAVGVLRRFAIELLARCGVTKHDAGLVTDALLDADLRGVSTHGLALLPSYLLRLKDGTANPEPHIRTVSEGAAVALIDGDAGLGPVAAVRGMELAISKALKHGVGAVAVRNANHLGAAGYYATLAARRTLFGLATSNAAAIMAPPGSASRVLSNNPIAVAFPAVSDPYVLVDLTLSVVSYGRIRSAAQRGEKIPLGWALDQNGVPTEDPVAALDGLLLPIGGHKGFGLALVLDVLTSALTAGFAPWEILERKHHGMGFFFLAINVSEFLALADFRERVDSFVRRIRDGKRLPGVDRIYVPGDRSAESRRTREENGIPLSSLPWDELRRVASELSVSIPSSVIDDRSVGQSSSGR
jgi:LDH2 family malate/lactate/ureidoglycolate dehydrogenase